MAKRKKSEITVEHFKKGRRYYGALHVFPDGRQVYLAHRRIREVFRSGEKSIAAAVDKETAAWALDLETLTKLRLRGVVYCGVEVKETGERFVTLLSHFFDKTKAKTLNYEGRGGAVQRYLPLQYFIRKPGAVRVK